MSNDAEEKSLHIDSDWKQEAAQEKERLAEQEEKQKAEGGPDHAAPGTYAATFQELVNLLAMQTAVALGGFQGPGGERIPPNPVAGKHYIDLLDILDKKTDGNLTEDEQRTLRAVLHELRMQYVQAVTPAPPSPSKDQEKT